MARTIGVRVAGRDQQEAEADHLGQSVVDTVRRPRVRDATRQALGEPEPTLDLGQHQHARVRGKAPTVEGDVHRLAPHG
jgi:hypothetical protein